MRLISQTITVGACLPISRRRVVAAINGYPCSSPGCDNAASWAVLSEVPREGDPTEWGVWNYSGTLACDGHGERAEDEAMAAEKRRHSETEQPCGAALP